jgi:DNA invertase Pin-like site-specific DNA recombinase
LKKGAAFRAFLDLITGGMILPGSVLLIEHIDRLSRIEAMDGLDLVKSIIISGVDIVTLIDGERYTRERLAKDFACLLKLVLLLFQSHEQSGTKSKRVGTAWAIKRQKAANGEWITQRCPSWLDKDTLKLIQLKVDILVRMFKLAAAGHGPGKIAKMFNAETIRTLDFGKKWSSGLVPNQA